MLSCTATDREAVICTKFKEQKKHAKQGKESRLTLQGVGRCFGSFPSETSRFISLKLCFHKYYLSRFLQSTFFAVINKLSPAVQDTRREQQHPTYQLSKHKKGGISKRAKYSYSTTYCTSLLSPGGWPIIHHTISATRGKSNTPMQLQAITCRGD